VFNKVRDDDAIGRIAEKSERYFDGPTLATVPASEAAREARRAGRLPLAHAPDSDAAAAFEEAAATGIDVRDGARRPWPTASAARRRPGPAMNLPDGRLLKSRVVSDPRYPLAGGAGPEPHWLRRPEPQETLLLEGEGRGVVTFRDGVPELTYATGTEQGGPAALGDLAMPGPYHVELYELPAGAFDALDDAAAFRVPPGMPAERLAGDPALAASTRRAAPGRPGRRGNRHWRRIRCR